MSRPDHGTPARPTITPLELREIGDQLQSAADYTSCLIEVVENEMDRIRRFMADPSHADWKLADLAEGGDWHVSITLLSLATRQAEAVKLIGERLELSKLA